MHPIGFGAISFFHWWFIIGLSLKSIQAAGTTDNDHGHILRHSVGGGSKNCKMKGKVPLFSIVTVCLNDLENLKITASSVEAQNFDDYEYVVVDGGSTDGSVEYITSVSPNYFISEPDDGIFFAMNKGLDLCTGEYICFMNAGDVFYDESVLMNVSKQIKKYLYIDLFYGDVIVTKNPRYFSKQPSKLTKFILYRTTGVCHQACFFRRKIYSETGGFDLTFKYEGDREFLTRMILEKKIRYKHLDLVVAKYKGGGFSELNKIHAHKEIEVIRQKYFSSVEIRFYSILLTLLNIIKKLPFYEKIMSFYAKLAYSLLLRNAK